MWVLLAYLAPLAITVAANLGVTRRGWRWLTYVALGLLIVLTYLAGLFLLVAPYFVRGRQSAYAAQVVGNTAPLALALLATAALSSLCLVPPVRRLLARWLSIDATSPVHTVGLVFVLYLSFVSLSLLFNQPDLMLDSLRTVSVGPGALVSGQVVMLVFALVGVGLGTRRSLRQTLQRLGLRKPTWRHLTLAAAMVVAFLGLDFAVAVVWQRLWPSHYQSVMEVTRQLFGPFDSLQGALILGLSAGIGEETLFRGALQPRFRLLLTAVVFTLGHVQYTLSPALLEILLIGLALGWLRQRTNTTTCLAAHAAYNFLDTLVMRFFP